MGQTTIWKKFYLGVFPGCCGVFIQPIPYPKLCFLFPCFSLRICPLYWSQHSVIFCVVFFFFFPFIGLLSSFFKYVPPYSLQKQSITVENENFWLISFETALLRCNWYTKNCIYLMCTNWWVWTYANTSDTLTRIKKKETYPTPSRMLYPFGFCFHYLVFCFCFCFCFFYELLLSGY